MLAPGSSPFPLIRNAIVNRLATAIGSYIPSGGSPPWVRPVANDNYQITATENWFAYVRTYGPTPVDSFSGTTLSDQGAGRLTVNVGRRVRFYLYSRAGMDVIGGDEITLSGLVPGQTVETPPSWPGHDILEELTLNAFINWPVQYIDPETESPVIISLGPMVWLDSADGPAERKPENEEGLVRSHLDFQVVYVLSNQIDEPAPATLPMPINNPV